MILKRLLIKNFRNIVSAQLELRSGINIVLGNNGNGKTNLLEAIYLLLNKRSFKKSVTFEDILSIDADRGEITLQGIFESDKESYQTLQLKKSESIWLRDGKVIRGSSEAALFVSPFDSYQYNTNPSFRREMMNQLFSTLSIEYKNGLKRYNALLKFKNSLLTHKGHDYLTQIESLHREMAPLLLLLRREKEELTSSLNEFMTPMFKTLFSENHEIRLQNSYSLESITVETLVKELGQFIEKEKIIGHATKGHQRDDYQLYFDGFLAFDFCSLGQKKVSYLALLFAYAELFRYKFKGYPILLIDDVSGELDRLRLVQLVDYLIKSDLQVLMTSASDELKQEVEKKGDVFKIVMENGRVTST